MLDDSQKEFGIAINVRRWAQQHLWLFGRRFDRTEQGLSKSRFLDALADGMKAFLRHFLKQRDFRIGIIYLTNP